MARPKSQNKRTQLNLTIETEVVKQIKKYADKKKKSLSVVTEEIYKSLLHNEKLINENPEELKRMIEMATPLIQEAMKKNKEGGNN